MHQVLDVEVNNDKLCAVMLTHLRPHSLLRNVARESHT